MLNMRRIKTDILILGSGGAGLFAALHAHQKNPKADITVAVKGLLGKSGCTRMVQGGYNVALAKEDSGDNFYKAKLATARFYFARLQPETAMLIRQARSGSANLMALDADLF